MNRTTHVVGLDAGTTGITALAIGADGRTLARASHEFAQSFPAPGWVEHDANLIWTTTRRVVADLYAASDLDPHAAVALGITNQRETVVAWDADGVPVAPAIVWQDRRTEPLCAAWRAVGLEPLARRTTGLVLDPYFSASKLRWWIDSGMDASRLRCGTIDSWLVWRMTGGRVHATDPTNASRTLLYDIHARGWSEELGRAFGVPLHWLPEVRPSAGGFGEVDDLPPLRRGLPIGGVAGDQQAALFGQRCVGAGDWKNTYGTGCFLMLHTGARALESQHGMLTTLACDAIGGPAYALEGAVFTAGAAVQWLRDGLGIVTDAADCERQAQTVSDSGGVVLVPAFTGLGAPHWRADARAALFGMTRGTRAAHICRAAIDAMAFQTYDVLSAMRADLESQAGATAEVGALRVDGGASRNDRLMQLQADLLQVAVDRPREIETTALGAAFLAGLGTGLWPDAAALDRARECERTFTPAAPTATRDAALTAWSDAVRRLVDG